LDNKYPEVVLLGQNVNSWHENGYGFADLLEKINDLEKIKRIRFLTSHPLNMNDTIIKKITSLEKVCEDIHLPIQSGDDEILKKMRRGYTVEFYRSIIEKIKKVMPNGAISTDIIVGFPGETEKQFENSVNIVKEISFDKVNTAAFSPRPNTKAADLPGQIEEKIKKERLNYLNKIVEETAQKKNQKLIGKTLEVLVEDVYDKIRLSGRTRTNKIVVFDSEKNLIGKFVEVEITEAKSWMVEGDINSSSPLRGED
jgi:tRNA-2-methylthio-N6-dimethylallyladenosine synthase